jgi:hypothetical protein
MFGSIAPSFGPTPDQMEEERKRIQFKKSVEYKKHSVRIFNIHDATERAEYEKMMKKLLAGMQAQTHMMIGHDRQLLTVDGNQKWHVYMEWCEFALKEEAIAPIGTEYEKTGTEP